MRGRLSLAVGTALALIASMNARGDDREFPSPVDRIFIPSAFDQDDVVELILHGSYPNSCYRAGRTGAHVDETSKTITVWAMSTLSDEPFCQQTFVSFLQVVKIGTLKGGRYTVLYRDGEARTQLDVKGLACDETTVPSTP